MSIVSCFKTISLPAALWVLSFLSALFFFNEWRLEMFAVSTLLLYAWAYILISRRLENGLAVPKSPVILFAGLFWLLVLCSVFWSDVKPDSLMAFAIFSGMPLTFLTAAFCADEFYLKKVGYCLAVIFAGLALWAMFQFFFLNSYFFGQARHPLQDPSSLGSLFSLGLFGSLGWLLSGRPKKEHRYAIALSAVLICGILSTVSRGPVYAFLPGAAILSYFLWPQIKANRKSLMIVGAFVLVFYGLMMTGIQKRFDLGERLMGAGTMAGDFTNNRVEIWSSALQMIKDKPLLGRGIGTFYLNYPQYRHAADVDGAYLAHNDPLQFWVELGVLGPLLFYAFCFAAAQRSFKALKVTQEKQYPLQRIVIASAFAGLASMVIGSHVGFNHYNLSILMMNGFMLSVWFVVSERVLGEVPMMACLPKTSPILNRVLLVLPFAMVAWLVLGIVAGEHYANRARDAMFSEQMFEFAEDVNKADRVSHGLNYRIYMFAVNVPMSILDFKKDKVTNEEATNLYNQTIDYMNKALSINPHAGDAYYYLGKVQSMVPSSVIPTGTPIPEEYFKKAIAQDPMHIGARLALVDLYRRMGKSAKDQLAVMEPGAEFYYTTPTATEYYSTLARLYLETKDYGKVKAVMYKMKQFDDRAKFSEVRQRTSIPQAIMGGEAMFPKYR